MKCQRPDLRFAAALAVLSGLAAFQAACLTLARHTYGAAVDTRTVKEQARDARVSAAIRKAYYDDKDMSVLGITPYVFLGKAYLVGKYESATQKEKALALAGRVEGVSSVAEFLFPKEKDETCGLTFEVKLRARIKAKLVGDKAVHATSVEVDSVLCRVVLIGLAGSQDEIARSVEHARSAEGARGVKSYLEVHKPAKD